MSWILGNYQTVLVIAAGIIAGASVALHAIAPYTKTAADDSLAAKLDWLLSKLSLNRPDK